MPLSENERRILQEIEQNLSESDPGLVELSNTTVYRHASRQLRWAALGLVISFAFLIATFASSVVLGIVGFVGMLACGWFATRAIQNMGKAGIHSLTMMIGRRPHLDADQGPGSDSDPSSTD